MRHVFTSVIENILESYFGDSSGEIFEHSQILQYINTKTRSAGRGSKSRSSYANLYALYVLVEDYIARGFRENDDYSSYEGAQYTILLKRQRDLPFGAKLQNHALNGRANDEFRKYFPLSEYLPIIRDVKKRRYWFNQRLLRITLGGASYDLAEAVISIIDAYIDNKRDAFQSFIKTFSELSLMHAENPESAHQKITDLLAQNVDARHFEIAAYAILKYYYINQTVFFGYSLDALTQEALKLYKTGRTNANDGGIDYVMRPLGRFFQVTETLDVKKYFLDIDKIERFPITFVIKSTESIDALRERLAASAIRLYSITAVVDEYMACIEEIINIPVLQLRFSEAAANGYLRNILDEIVLQSTVEFNYREQAEDDPDEQDELTNEPDEDA